MSRLEEIKAFLDIMSIQAEAGSPPLLKPGQKMDKKTEAKLRYPEKVKSAQEAEKLANATDIHFAEGDAERIVQARKQAYETKQDAEVIVTAFGLNEFSGRSQRKVVLEFCTKVFYGNKYYQVFKAGKTTGIGCMPVYQIKHSVKEDCIKFQLTFKGADEWFRERFEGDAKLMHSVEELREITAEVPESKIKATLKCWIKEKVQEQEIVLRTTEDFDSPKLDSFTACFYELYRMDRESRLAAATGIGNAKGERAAYNMALNQVLESFRAFLEGGAFEDVDLNN